MFEPFPKIARLNRECIVTEKLDGTNAQVFIVPYEERDNHPELQEYATIAGPTEGRFLVAAGSRSRWLKPTKDGDNYGFASWVLRNSEELIQLGPGRHFGEWWGQGIQRNYGLKEKRFSLFNVARWENERPACCEVVPVLYRGRFDSDSVDWVVCNLRDRGSAAAPGFMKPEGVIVYHTAQQTLFKVTCENDESPKSLAA